MTTTTEQITVDVLDDDEHRTPAWQQLRQQHGEPGTTGIPRGTYDATLIEADIVRRKDTGAFVLRMVARTDRLGRYVVAWRGLADDGADPFDLTEPQVRGLRKFAEQMGIGVPAPARLIVDSVIAMLGSTVQAKVTHTVVGQQATLSRQSDPSTSPVTLNGVVVDEHGEIVGSAADDGRAAVVAFGAHAKLLEGLSAARFGFARAAEGCNTLMQTEGWLALGFESLSEYLASPEVTLSRSEFYRLAEIWRRYVLDGGVAPEVLQGAGPSKLEVPLPALEQGMVSAEVAAADASSLSRRDLRDRYRTLLGKGEDSPEPEPARAGDEPGAGASDDDGFFDSADESRRRDDDWQDPSTDLENVNAAYVVERDEAQRLRVENERLALEGVTVVTAARDVVAVLARVFREIGAPEQKRMSKVLRAAVVDALAAARQHGLDVEAGP